MGFHFDGQKKKKFCFFPIAKTHTRELTMRLSHGKKSWEKKDEKFNHEQNNNHI